MAMTMLIDAYGRKIDTLRISVTDRCNLRCRYCMPDRGILNRPRHELLSFEEIAKMVKAAAQSGIANVRLTGGEPLIRKGLADLVESLDGIDGIRDISLTTNGVLLRRYARGLKKAGLRRLNISLDSLNSDRYRWMTRGGELDEVLEGIEEAVDAGYFLIKINVLLLDDATRREIPEFLRLTLENCLHVRFLEFMPIGPFQKRGKFVPPPNTPTFRSGIDGAGCRTDRSQPRALARGGSICGKEILDIAQRFGEVEKAATYGNGPAVYYRFKHSLGTFGMISPITGKFCAGCNRLRLTSDGFLKTCLDSDIKVNVRDPLRRDACEEELIRLITLAASMKPKEHSMGERSSRSLESSMCQIGG